MKGKQKRVCRRILSWVVTVALFVSVITVSGYLGWTPQSVKAAVTPVEAHGALSVNGTQLVDKNGKAFQIRGISTHGLGFSEEIPAGSNNWMPFNDFVNKAALQELRDDWKANCIRLAMYTDEWGGYCTGSGNDTAMKQKVENGIKLATELGMYVVVDWHILNTNPQDHQTESIAFFDDIVSRYKDYDNIIYEICNEPANISWTGNIKPYAEAVIPVIRKHDADAVIIVGTPTWSQLGNEFHTYEACENPITGYSNIMYALHFYASEDGHYNSLRGKMTKAIEEYNTPVFISEFGLSEASGDGNVNISRCEDWMKLCDDYNVSYCAWSLSNKNETSALLASGLTKTSGWTEADLSVSGRFIRNWYRNRPSQETDSASSEDQQPTSEDQQPTSEDRQPTSEDQQPTSEDQQPTSEDQQPYPVETVKTSIKSASISVTGIRTSYVYNGKAFTPKPVLTDNGVRLVLNRDYTISYTRNRNVGKAAVIIRGKGNYSKTRVIAFKILPKRTTIKKLTAKNGNMTVLWNKQVEKMANTRITGYQLQYSQFNNFPSGKTKSLKVKGATTKSTVIKGLKKGKLYYVRIRTYKVINGVTYYSSWSSIKKKTVK